MTTEVLDIIRQAIVDGQFKVGEQLNESRLAKQLHVSRAPVREALQKLEKDGLIVHFPHRGHFVRTISLEEVEDLFQLRAALEGLAVRLFIEKAESDDIESMEQIVLEMESSEEEADEIRAAELDTKFHEHLCRLSGNGRLLDLWISMRSQICIAVLATNASFGFSRSSKGFAEAHRKVLESIRKRDPGLAQAVLAEHIEVGFENLRREFRIET
jgi:DNA-binding GntR family transcriptional regulator